MHLLHQRGTSTSTNTSQQPASLHSTAEDYATSHCKRFRGDLKACLEHVWPRDVHTLRLVATSISASASGREEEGGAGAVSPEVPPISLVVATSWTQDVLSGAVEEALQSFEGHQVRCRSGPSCCCG
jgi:hypothetical protein